MPRSTAERIAALDSSSSCVPQAQRHPAPPRAHAPNPTRVIRISASPKRVVGKVSVCVLIFVSSLRHKPSWSVIEKTSHVAFSHPAFITTGAIRLFLTNADDYARYTRQNRGVRRDSS